MTVECRCCAREQPPALPRVCPECGHRFRGNGWDGIDAHWRAKHESVLSYEHFWATLCRQHRGPSRQTTKGGETPTSMREPTPVPCTTPAGQSGVTMSCEDCGELAEHFVACCQPDCELTRICPSCAATRPPGRLCTICCAAFDARQREASVKRRAALDAKSSRYAKKRWLS